MPRTAPLYLFVLSTLCLLAGSVPARADMVIDNFSSATNDRFANDGGFIAGSVNLSGVGISSDGGWVTMISPNVYLTAYHMMPGIGSSVTFYAGNNPLGASLTRSIGTRTRIGTTDIGIGTLDTSLSTDYSYYNYATQSITSTADFNASSYAGATAYWLGRSPTAFADISQDMAVGQNKLDVWLDNVTVGPTTAEMIGSLYDSFGDANYLTYESRVQAGDSGAPLLFESSPGVLEVLGLNWAELSGPSGSGTSYVGNHQGDIAAYLSANSLAAVPEPSTYALFTGLGVLGWAAYRRRIRRSCSRQP